MLEAKEDSVYVENFVVDHRIPKGWTEITNKDGIYLDLKYASTENFTNQQIYDCARCFLTNPAARAINLLQRRIRRKYNVNLYIYDCYRPRPAQQKLWDIIPNPNYVAPPSKGSMHNRGLAVDLAFADSLGRPLDFGSPFDSFGRKSHSDNRDFPSEILTARDSLRSWMISIGFKGIRTEWWHYSLQEVSRPISDWEWECD